MNEIEKQDKHIAKIKSSISNLTDILNDFLSVSKLEEGKVENTSEEFNLKGFISDIASDMKTILKEGQVIDCKHAGKESVRLDKKLLKHIFLNLISNAIKFSLEKKSVEISSEADKSSIKITIKDHGIGISQEDQKHLFERFFRGHNASNIQGTGLGLNIVARYVELMNGSIEYTSEENKGTQFTLTFPQ